MRMRWAGHLGRTGKTNNAYKILTGRPRSRWQCNVKMNLTGMGCRGRNWVHLPQDCVHLPQDRVQWRALVNTSNETSCLIKGFELLNQLRNYQLLKEDSAPKLRGWLVFRSRKFQYEESNTNWA